MEVTNEWLKENRACEDGFEWALKRNYTDALLTVKALIKCEKVDWANWVIVRLMTRQQKSKYAVYAAELVIHIYEEKYPNDPRPRKAIEAAKNLIKATENAIIKPVIQNYNIVSAADHINANAAVAAAEAALYAINRNDISAARAANTASYVARSVNPSYSSAHYTADAADSAYEAYVDKEIQINVINYGMSLLGLDS